MNSKKDTAPPPGESGDTEAEGGTPPAPAGKLGFLRNKKVLIGLVGGLVVLAGGGGAALFLSGGHKAEAGQGAEEGEAAAEEEEAPAEESGGEGKDGELPLVDVPPMIVNLRTADGEGRYLKLHFMLEARTAAKADKLKAQLPAIIDAYQPFLRELRPEDVSGSAAVFRIKEEMLARATDVAGRGVVRDVLIQDLVQQ